MTSMQSAAIRAEGVSKAFDRSPALIDASVTVGQGELVALLGPSGSGKTTLLRIVAGLETPDTGTISINGTVVAGDTAWTEPEDRRVGMVFQDGALFPHLTVGANVAFGVSDPGRVDTCLDLVGLTDRAGSYPHQLSGGERSRVALARALAPEPAVILLDEPFASLDAALRVALRDDVTRILREAGASALFVTHDQEEALSVADTVVVLRGGRVEQAGSPEHVYQRPVNRWVAEFVGAADVLTGVVTNHEVECALGSFPVDDPLPHTHVDVIVRPEYVALSNGEGRSGVPARVVGTTYFGHDHLVTLELEDGTLLHSRSRGVAPWTAGQSVGVTLDGPVRLVPHSPE